jgi:hypothetical protein
MTGERELMRTAALGMDAEAFLGSTLGKQLVQRANDEIDAAVEELKRADPENVKQIRELQNHIWKAESFINWLGEIYQEGNNAELQLQTPGDGE